MPPFAGQDKYRPVCEQCALNMSDGRQQRAGVARALAMQPDLILADEPAGNLDSKSAEVVFSLMRVENEHYSTSFLIVTHNMDLARRCDRISTVVGGRIGGNPE